MPSQKDQAKVATQDEVLSGTLNFNHPRVPSSGFPPPLPLSSRPVWNGAYYSSDRAPDSSMRVHYIPTPVLGPWVDSANHTNPNHASQNFMLSNSSGGASTHGPRMSYGREMSQGHGQGQGPGPYMNACPQYPVAACAFDGYSAAIPLQFSDRGERYACLQPNPYAMPSSYPLPPPGFEDGPKSSINPQIAQGTGGYWVQVPGNIPQAVVQRSSQYAHQPVLGAASTRQGQMHGVHEIVATNEFQIKGEVDNFGPQAMHSDGLAPEGVYGNTRDNPLSCVSREDEGLRQLARARAKNFTEKSSGYPCLTDTAKNRVERVTAGSCGKCGDKTCPSPNEATCNPSNSGDIAPLQVDANLSLSQMAVNMEEMNRRLEITEVALSHKFSTFSITINGEEVKIFIAFDSADAAFIVDEIELKQRLALAVEEVLASMISLQPLKPVQINEVAKTSENPPVDVAPGFFQKKGVSIGEFGEPVAIKCDDHDFHIKGCEKCETYLDATGGLETPDEYVELASSLASSSRKSSINLGWHEETVIEKHLRISATGIKTFEPVAVVKKVRNTEEMELVLAAAKAQKQANLGEAGSAIATEIKVAKEISTIPDSWRKNFPAADGWDDDVYYSLPASKLGRTTGEVCVDWGNMTAKSAAPDNCTDSISPALGNPNASQEMFIPKNHSGALGNDNTANKDAAKYTKLTVVHDGRFVEISVPTADILGQLHSNEKSRIQA